MTDAPNGAGTYSGNSNRDKEPEVVVKPKVEKLISGEAIAKKKPLGRRIAENFTGADAHSVGQYVLFQVILPQLKDMIFDVGQSALQRALFGDSGGKVNSYSSSTRRGYTPYGSIASSATPKQAVVRAAAQEPSDEFGEIIVENRGEAQEVMDKMSNLIETYGMASVSDLKAAVGISGKFTDEKWGWVGMGGTDIRRVGGPQPGFRLIFPRPEELV